MADIKNIDPKDTEEDTDMDCGQKGGFLHGTDGKKSSNRLMAVGVTFVLLGVIVGVQAFRVYQDLKSGTPIQILEVNFSIVLLLLSAYAPKFAEVIAEVIKLKASK